MAKLNIPPRTTSTRYGILDVDGTALQPQPGVRATTTNDAQGGLTQDREFTAILTADGTVYHAGMNIALVVCACCRRGGPGEPPVHGLCPKDDAVRCSAPGCGAWACPRHAYLTFDGHAWLCRDCRPGWVSRLLHALFWVRVDKG